MPPDTLNKFAVRATDAGEITIGNLPLQARTGRLDRGGLPAWPAAGPLSKAEALNLAAWLVIATGGDRKAFAKLLDAILAT